MRNAIPFLLLVATLTVSSGANADVRDFDIAGLRLYSTPDEFLATLKKRYGETANTIQGWLCK